MKPSCEVFARRQPASSSTSRLRVCRRVSPFSRRPPGKICLLFGSRMTRMKSPRNTRLRAEVTYLSGGRGSLRYPETRNVSLEVMGGHSSQIADSSGRGVCDARKRARGEHTQPPDMCRARFTSDKGDFGRSLTDLERQLAQLELHRDGGVARKAGGAEAVFRQTDGADEAVEAEIGERVGADEAADLAHL